MGIHGTIRRALHAGKGHHIARLLAIALLLGRPVIARLLLGKALLSGITLGLRIALLLAIRRLHGRLLRRHLRLSGLLCGGLPLRGSLLCLPFPLQIIPAAIGHATAIFSLAMAKGVQRLPAGRFFALHAILHRLLIQSPCRRTPARLRAWRSIRPYHPTRRG